MTYLTLYEIVNLPAKVIYAHNACYGTTASGLICKHYSSLNIFFLIFPCIFKNIQFLYHFKYYFNITFCSLFCNLFKDWSILLLLVGISYEFLSNSIRYLIYLIQSTMGYWVLKSLLELSPFSIQMPLLMIRLNVCYTEVPLQLSF